MAIKEFQEEKAKYNNRKELLIHYLKELHNSNRPVTFSDLLLNNLPSGGIEEFESVMTELEKKGLISKTEEDGGPVQGLPFHRTVIRKFSISLEGVEYLADLNIIEDQYKTKKKESPTQQINIHAPVTGSQIGQSSDFRESRLDMKSKNDIIQIPTDTPKPKSSQDIWEKLKSVAQILGFGAALIALITKLMDLW